MMEKIVNREKVLYQGRICEYARSVSTDKVQIYDIANRAYLIVEIADLQSISLTSIIPEINKKETDRNIAELSIEMDEARRRFEVIKQCIAEEGSLKEIVAGVSRRLGLSEPHCYHLVGDYDADAGPGSLMRYKRGQKTGTRRLSPVIESIISHCIKTEWKGPGADRKKVYKAVKEMCQAANLSPPCINTLGRRINSEKSAKELTRLKSGKKAASDKYDARPKQIKRKAPLEFWQMDHTVIDCIIVDEKNRQALCRPWVTLIIDVCTRVVMGYYLSIHAPSSVSVAMAIMHAVMPKRDWLKSLGVDDIAYPYYGKPQAIGMDNAKEFKAKCFRYAADKHDIKLCWRPPRIPHWGGHIERLNGTLQMGYVKYLPGATLSNVVLRGDYDSEKEAAMTFSEFSVWFARAINIYHLEEHRMLGKSPHEKWLEFYTDSVGQLSHPPLLSDAFEFFVDFLPEESRVISRSGLVLNSIWYWSDDFKPLIGSDKKFVVKYNPLSLRQVWVRDNENRYIQASYSDVGLPDITLQERKLIREKGKTPPKNEAEIFEKILANRDLVNNSVNTTKRFRKVMETSKLSADQAWEQLVDDDKQRLDHQENLDYQQQVIPYEPEE
ncbi:DDE-type integrase/transposase/recombinase [Pseudomonas koreensis]|nr:DDE-type integrase/transposase/recombinase [Pseudomonas koreensis]